MLHDKKPLTEDDMNRIFKMYREGAFYENIAATMHITLYRLQKIITQAKKDGIIGERIKAEPLCMKEGAVRCTKSVSRKCKYGTSSQDYLCDYYFMNGKQRGCSWKECTVFEPKNTKRRRHVPDGTE